MESIRWLVALLLVVTPLSLRAQEPVAPATDTSPSGWQLVEMSGTVHVKSSGTAPWTAARPDQHLDDGAAVRTSSDGKAMLRGQDAAGVALQSNTVVEVGSLTVRGEITKASCKALGGKSLFLINTLKNQESSFIVETPTAIVGVRGTAFAVKVAEDAASSRVAVFHGEVSVSSLGPEPGMVIVKEKMGTNIVRNQPPTPPEALDEAEAAEWERMKSEIQNSTPLAGVVPAIGGMIEMHQLQNAEAEQIIRNANLAIKGNRKSEQDFKIFWAAIIQYFKDTGAVPSPDQGLQVLLEDPRVGGWKGPYLDKDSNLLDPYGKAYQWNMIRSPTGKDIFELRSGGPDGFPGNEDDHRDILYRWKLEKLAKEPPPAGQ